MLILIVPFLYLWDVVAFNILRLNSLRVTSLYGDEQSKLTHVLLLCSVEIKVYVVKNHYQNQMYLVQRRASNESKRVLGFLK